MVDDAIVYGEISEKGNDPHLSAALGTAQRKGTRTEFQRIRNMSPLQLSRPSLGGNALLVLLGHPQDEGAPAGLPHFPSVGVGIKAVVMDPDFLGDTNRIPENSDHVPSPFKRPSRGGGFSGIPPR